MLSIHRSLLCCTLVALSFLAACDDGAPAIADIETSVSPLEDAATGELDVTPIEATQDVADAADAEVEILYPGYLCGGDKQCSTGLCYGFANAQGAFEKPKCQALCLELNDFARYCDSNDDCCRGRCCLDCGAREGLCVLD